jgi:hypothetical protein
MVAGDEEYREPNTFLWIVIGFLVVAVLILSIGTYLLAKA